MMVVCVAWVSHTHATYTTNAVVQKEIWCMVKDWPRDQLMLIKASQVGAIWCGVSKSVVSLTHATGHSDWYAFMNCLHGA
jgi:hypothetical protein